MTNEEIVERIAQGEDSRTQFKLGPIGVAKLAAELAAFSNAAGGVILFGVGDGGEVIGLDAAAKKLLTVIVKRNKGCEVVNEVVNSANETVNGEFGGVNGGVKSDIGPVNDPVNTGCGPVNVPINEGNVPMNVPVNDSLCEKMVELVSGNPGINRVELASKLSVTVRTIGRLVTELQGKIEFRGAPKNGGYYVIESIEREGSK